MKVSHVAIVIKPEHYGQTVEKFKKILKGDFYERVLEDQKIKVALLKLENASIELITPIGMGSSVDNFLEKKGGGIHHFAIAVENLENEVKRLKNEGFDFAVEDMKGAKGKVAFIHPKSAGGVLIEIVEDEY